MPVVSYPQIVLDEANDVLAALSDWSRQAPYCPNCLSLPRCSHEAGCPVGRVARLRCLLGFGDQQSRDAALVAVRRERGELVTSDGDRAMPSGSAPVSASTATDLLLPMSVHIETEAQDQSAVPLVRTLGDVDLRGGPPANDALVDDEARDLAPDASPLEPVEDAQARSFVVETLQVAAARCFAEASAMRGRADQGTAGPVRATAAALAERAGRYAEAAVGWLTRNGADALLGQRALLGACARRAEPLAEPEGAP